MKMSFLRKNGGRTFYVCTGSYSFCGCRYVKPRWFLAFLTRLGLVRPNMAKVVALANVIMPTKNTEPMET